MWGQVSGLPTCRLCWTGSTMPRGSGDGHLRRAQTAATRFESLPFYSGYCPLDTLQTEYILLALQAGVSAYVPLRSIQTDLIGILAALLANAPA